MSNRNGKCKLPEFYNLHNGAGCINQRNLWNTEEIKHPVCINCPVNDASLVSCQTVVCLIISQYLCLQYIIKFII